MPDLPALRTPSTFCTLTYPHLLSLCPKQHPHILDKRCFAVEPADNQPDIDSRVIMIPNQSQQKVAFYMSTMISDYASSVLKELATQVRPAAPTPPHPPPHPSSSPAPPRPSSSTAPPRPTSLLLPRPAASHPHPAPPHLPPHPTPPLLIRRHTPPHPSSSPLCQTGRVPGGPVRDAVGERRRVVAV